MQSQTTSSARLPAGLKFTLFLARVGLGVSMLELGLRLFLEGGWGAWMNIGVVLPTTYPRGPIGAILEQFWGNQAVIQLLIWASVLVGAALIFGVAVRLASYGGIVMMIALYLAVIPPASLIVNQHIVYALLFLVIVVSKAGKIGGFDSWLEVFEEQYPMLRYLLG